VDGEKPTQLPEGVSLNRSDGGGYELRITAPDGDELVWRLHDLVAMIQDGRFDEMLDRADPPSAEGQS
jgi:hypothetical protein